jgi:undecaprenyl diphosphate synthase
MDGNRRYARERGLSTAEGHRLGFEKAKEVAEWCRGAGVRHLILYAFSTENWNRPPEEVAYLTTMMQTLLLDESDKLRGEGGALRFVGELERFGADFCLAARKIEAENPPEPALTVTIALSYGGRPEILSAVNALLAEGAKDPVTEQEFAKRLWTAALPDPDLLLRTGGEMRLSNFLPWQSAYSELFFSDTYWPALTKEEFSGILQSYSERERRMGK